MRLVVHEGELGVGVLVHGGAGHVPPLRRARHVEGCRAAAAAGRARLDAGQSALDAAVAAVVALENDEVFNAGRGACLNVEGRVEHDAAVMEGTRLGAAGLGALSGFANPIQIARRLLEAERHVLLVGEGAARFAREAGFHPVDPESLITEAAREALERVRAHAGPETWAGGTVGAVARDAEGRLAAATSTGGTIAKAVGRVGDSPIPGAGTYADDATGAVSATGDGEGILRVGLALRVTLALGAGAPMRSALEGALTVLFERTGKRAGLIALDAAGRYGLALSTTTMSWALDAERATLAGSE